MRIGILVALTTILLILSIALSYSQTEKTRVLTTIADSFVMSDIPPAWISQGYDKGKNQNFGHDTFLIAWNDADFYSLIFIKFNLSSIPNGSSIQSATLKLHTPDIKPIDSSVVSVYSCPDNSWNEYTICWNNKPSFDSTSIDSVTIVAPREGDYTIKGYWYSWDVTTPSLVAFSGDSKKLTLVISSQYFDSTTWYPATFDSRETSNKPKLTVTYVEYQQQNSNNGYFFQLMIILTAISIGSALILSVYFVKKHRKKAKAEDVAEIL